MKRSPTLIHLFVYGTLKRGQSNHDACCRGMSRVREGSVPGALYELPSGDPILKVDAADILAHGTANPLTDAAIQESFAGKAPAPPPPADGPCAPNAPRRRIRGEILTFDDPEYRLPLMDELEEFRADKPSLYLRVLLPAQTCDGASLAAWAYVCGPLAHELRPVESDAWFPSP